MVGIVRVTLFVNSDGTIEVEPYNDIANLMEPESLTDVILGLNKNIEHYPGVYLFTVTVELDKPPE